MWTSKRERESGNEDAGKHTSCAQSSYSIMKPWSKGVLAASAVEERHDTEAQRDNDRPNFILQKKWEMSVRDESIHKEER